MLRIRKTGWKTLYIVVGWVAVVVLSEAVRPLGISALVAAGLRSVLFLAFVVVAARVFRGHGEALSAPRAWWRMTARPAAGFVLGSYFSVTVLADLVLAFASSGAPSSGRFAPTALVVDAIATAPLVFLYLNSSIRLVRNPPTVAPEALPAWKPIKR